MNTAVIKIFISICLLEAITSQDLPPNIQIYPVGSEVRRPPTTTTTTTTTTTPRPTVRVPEWPRNANTGLTAADVLAQSPFTCSGLIDGHYADVKYNCRFFHNCHFFEKDDGHLYVQQAVFQCGLGTSFNQSTLTCDYEANVDCNRNVVKKLIEDYQTAPTPLPGRGKPVVFPNTNFKCSLANNKQGYYYADMEVRCQMYHRCTYHEDAGIVYATQYSFLCPPGTIFDQATISCNHESEVKCSESRLYENEQAALHPIY